MKIEAICANNGLHPEYLLRVSHKELMALGAVTFDAGEELSVLAALKKSLEPAMNQLRWATRAIEATGEHP